MDWWEKRLEINKRTGTFIRHYRVPTDINLGESEPHMTVSHGYDILHMMMVGTIWASQN